MSDQTIPPDFVGRSFEDVIESLMYDDHEAPYWVRRNGGKKEPWEVCYHGEKGVVSPVSVGKFYDWSDAKACAVRLTVGILRKIANG